MEQLPLTAMPQSAQLDGAPRPARHLVPTSGFGGELTHPRSHFPYSASEIASRTSAGSRWARARRFTPLYSIIDGFVDFAAQPSIDKAIRERRVAPLNLQMPEAVLLLGPPASGKTIWRAIGSPGVSSPAIRWQFVPSPTFVATRHGA